MDKDLHDIEDLFRSSLDQHEEMPSKNVWDAVDNRLDKETVATIKKKYKTLKRLSLLLLLLLISISIFELGYHNSDKGRVITSSTEINRGASSGKTDTNPEDQISKTPPTTKQENDSKKIHEATVSTTSDQSATDKAVAFNSEQSNNEAGITEGKENHKNIPIPKKNLKTTAHLAQYRQTLFQRFDKKKSKPRDRMEIIEDLVLQTNWNVHSDRDEETKSRFPYVQKISRIIIDAPAIKKLDQLLPFDKINIPIPISTAEINPQKKKPVVQSKFSITGFFSPELASYRLEDEDVPNQSENSTLIKKSERHEFSYNSGILVGYALNDKFNLQSGITFSNTNIAIEPKTIYAQTVSAGNIKYRLNISSGFGYLTPRFQPSPAIGDSVRVTATVHKLNYIRVPIGVKYTITSGKIKVQTMAGITANFLTRGKLETEIQRGATNEIDLLNKIEGLKSIYLSGQMGIGAEFIVSRKISLLLMPTAHFAFSPINKSGVVKTFPYSFGINGGLQIRL